MVSRLVVQQVKEVFDSQRDGTTGAEDHREQIVHKLLQRPLKNMEWEEGEPKFVCYSAIMYTLQEPRSQCVNCRHLWHLCVCVCTFMDSRRVR